MSDFAKDINDVLNTLLGDESNRKEVLKYLSKIARSGKINGDEGVSIYGMEKADMQAAADDLIQEIYSDAAASGIPTSVLSSISMAHSGIPAYDAARGKWCVDIVFDNLHRDSLYQKGYPGGLRNILAAFNNGVNARKKVYGIWKGHHATSPYVKETPDGVFVASKQTRIGAHFIQNGVNNFLAKYSKYNIEVEIGTDYELAIDADDDDGEEEY